MVQPMTQADVQVLIAAVLAPVQQDLADAQAEVNRIQGQIIQQAAAAPHPVAPAQIPFARTPATASRTMIDYKTKYGLEVYKMGSEKLKSEFDHGGIGSTMCNTGIQGNHLDNKRYIFLKKLWYLHV
jgi:hypothetical protein